MKVKSSKTVLMCVTAKQFKKFADGNCRALLKPVLIKEKDINLPFTVYFYILTSTRYSFIDGLKIPQEALFTYPGDELTISNLQAGNCPSDLVLDGGKVYNKTILGKATCSGYKVMYCSERYRQMYAEDVGMTPDEILDAYFNKDVGVWYLDNFQLFKEPATLEDFDLDKSPQSWCFIEDRKAGYVNE